MVCHRGRRIANTTASPPPAAGRSTGSAISLPAPRPTCRSSVRRQCLEWYHGRPLKRQPARHALAGGGRVDLVDHRGARVRCVPRCPGEAHRQMSSPPFGAPTLTSAAVTGILHAFPDRSVASARLDSGGLGCEAFHAPPRALNPACNGWTNCLLRPDVQAKGNSVSRPISAASPRRSASVAAGKSSPSRRYSLSCRASISPG